MKNHLTALLILLLSIWGTGCWSTFVVTFPAASKAESQEYSIVNDHYQITLHFDRSADTSTVVIGKTFILKTDKDPNAAGTIAWTDEHRTAVFTTTKTTTQLDSFNTDSYFTLTLIGTATGNGLIKDKYGVHLDGDKNGVEGGDYYTTFVHFAKP